jgi:integrase
MTDQSAVPVEVVVQPKARRKPPAVRGVYEKVKGSGTWWIHYRDAQGRRRREKGGTRGMALQLLAKRKGEAVRGKKLPESLRRKPVAVSELLDLAEQHARTHFTSRRHGKGGAADWRYPTLLAEFGALDAAALTPQRIEQGLAKLGAARNWAGATANRQRDYLSVAFRLGMRNGLVASNPARLVCRRREDNGRIRFLSPADEAKLRAVIQAEFPEHEPEFDLALATGLRQGAQFRLRWQDVDLEARQITIGRAKNGRPFYAPINSAALAALARLKALAGDSEWVTLNRNTRGRGVGQPPCTPESWFNRAVARAGLNDVCWHTLRHTFASRAVMAGLDLRVVADLLGHRTLAMVMRYAHLAPQFRLEASERVAAAFPPVQTATRTATGGFDGAGDGGAEQTQVVTIQ